MVFLFVFDISCVFFLSSLPQIKYLRIGAAIWWHYSFNSCGSTISIFNFIQLSPPSGDWENWGIPYSELLFYSTCNNVCIQTLKRWILVGWLNVACLDCWVDMAPRFDSRISWGKAMYLTVFFRVRFVNGAEEGGVILERIGRRIFVNGAEEGGVMLERIGRRIF